MWGTSQHCGNNCARNQSLDSIPRCTLLLCASSRPSAWNEKYLSAHPQTLWRVTDMFRTM